MNEIKYLSHSRIEKYLTCPRRYEYEYILGMKGPYNFNLLLGNSVHTTMEKNYKQKMDSGQDLDLDEFIGLYQSYYDDNEDTIEGRWTTKNERVKIVSNMTASLREYHKKVAPTIQPIAVELELWTEYKGVKLMGFIDLIDTNIQVYDHKTSKNKPWQNFADKTYQLKMYNMLCRGNNIIPTGFHFDALTKQVPGVHRRSDYITDKSMECFEKALDGVIAGIQHGVFPPNVKNNLCSERYCPNYDDCQG